MPQTRSSSSAWLRLAMLLAMATAGPGTAVARDQGISTIVFTVQEQAENLRDVPGEQGLFGGKSSPVKRWSQSWATR